MKYKEIPSHMVMMFISEFFRVSRAFTKPCDSRQDMQDMNIENELWTSMIAYSYSLSLARPFVFECHAARATIYFGRLPACFAVLLRSRFIHLRSCKYT